MADKIQIDIISDVVCPWCIIGYKHLEKAITELGLEDRIEIEWKPFELNPDMPAEGENLRAHIARKYSSSPEESAKSRANITNIAGELASVVQLTTTFLTIKNCTSTPSVPGS